ncbi:transcriptional regulator GlxA family with amidase domain [Actimicrobium sp. GrIS 1.19]|uniref:DJ-1/PfpI family protein n=1 Tax=Actimicrobium sp. GrIS 1.19 TaxID=3071708 RepID=UPI002E040C9C|nr:transcriptional regulator GlxA family with amidase domain [Actimicrobium sp. GrIS 1.19]
MPSILRKLFTVAVLCATCALATTSFAADPPTDHIAPYHDRFGRTRPVVAVIGENRGTELIDFMVPFSVLTQSGAADTIAVATHAGPLTMRPALQIMPQATIEAFDARYPEGADYVIVPAVVHSDDTVLLAWIAAQGASGSTIVSICDGALVVANTGLMKGHRATGHWATDQLRQQNYPDTQWLQNARYVADGRIVSSAGISAAMPTALALVEAIAGPQRAAALAAELGVSSWDTQHDSAVFHPRLGLNLTAFATTHFTNGWWYPMQDIGVLVAPGVDDIALALTMDAYSRTGRSRARSLAGSAQPILTRHGLTVLPDRVIAAGNQPTRVLPEFAATAPAQALDQALAGIALMYGKNTAYGVALDLEYPGFRN